MNATNLLEHGYFWAFVSVFVGGFLTSLTPCVYPLIPITVSVFGARDEHSSRGRALLLAGSYVGGIGVMYSGLGVSSALAGRAFGTFMANGWVMAPIAILFLAMAASMFGAFELNLPPALANRLSTVGGRGFGGAFAMGLVGGIIAAPCTGPVLASVLAFVATTRSVAVGGLLLFTYALGMGVLFVAIAASAVRLPRSGPWMESVKSVFGVTMVVAALYFLRNVVGPLRDYGRPTAGFLAAHVGLAIAGLALGALGLSFHGDLRTRLRKGLGVAALTVGVFGGVAWVLAPKPAEGAPSLSWVHGERDGVGPALASSKPILLDFFADWCLPCKELELRTFSNPEVARELARFSLVKVDCTTDDDPKVVELKQRFGAETLPTLVLLHPGGASAQKIDHFVEPAQLLAALRTTR